jgi:probable DNA metabolism protein
MSGESSLNGILLPHGEAAHSPLAPDETFIRWAAAGQPEDFPGCREIERHAHYAAQSGFAAEACAGDCGPQNGGSSGGAAADAGPKLAHRLRHADLVYCYDGSFEGFLCCVFESFVRRELPFAVWPAAEEQATLYPSAEILTDPAKADRVFTAYCKKLGGAGRRLLLTVFLSGAPDKELALLRFLHLAFQEGPRTLALLGHEDVAPIYAMDKAIGREVEHLMGFVRFEEAGGMLGAVIHPKNHVLPLLRGHFCSRYPEEDFLIYDATHGAALLQRAHHAELLQLDAPLTLPSPDEKESYYQALWKQFYRTLAIAARRNEALRRQMCPKRFWADMTELRGER